VVGRSSKESRVRAGRVNGLFRCDRGAAGRTGSRVRRAGEKALDAFAGIQPGYARDRDARLTDGAGGAGQVLRVGKRGEEDHVIVRALISHCC
jgi:hypothetical protein